MIILSIINSFQHHDVPGRELMNAIVMGMGGDNYAARRNGIYGGINLGTSVSAEQYASIQDGTFNDMFIGDYWVINDRVYRIADFDYYLGTGDIECTDHHIVIVPDIPLYNAAMNDTNTTGAYIGSKMYTTNLTSAKNTIQSDFGNEHILTHRQFFANAITNNYESAMTWYDSKIDFMNEQNVYGGKVFHNAMQGIDFAWLHTVDKSQFSLFVLAPEHIICDRIAYWLRDVSRAGFFACVRGYGFASDDDESDSRGVRPAFCIYQAA